eukprot:5660672-Prymnesium_polylepis.2
MQPTRAKEILQVRLVEGKRVFHDNVCRAARMLHTLITNAVGRAASTREFECCGGVAHDRQPGRGRAGGSRGPSREDCLPSSCSRSTGTIQRRTLAALLAPQAMRWAARPAVPRLGRRHATDANAELSRIRPLPCTQTWAGRAR